MKSIYKYKLKVQESNVLEIKSNNILSAMEQENEIMVYALVDDSVDTKKYEVNVYGTGQEILKDDIDTYTFLNTVKVDWCVSHVFYKEIVE
jgi:hypothetical protein